MAMAISESNITNVDEYGFKRPEDFDYEGYKVFISRYIRILTKRSIKWSSLVKGEKKIQKSTTLKRYVRKGIPSEFRPSVWMSVSEADVMKHASPDLYQTLLESPFQKELVDIIKTDLPRTFPENINFDIKADYQAHLFNILVAYAHHNQEVGYCQGLNYIAGLLFLATKNEETSFWLLKALVERILPQYYTRTMSGLIVDTEVLSEFVKTKVPDVYQHVINLGLPWAVITTKWFVCLFAEVLPVETVLRIWDCLFYEGSKILFRVCLTLVKVNRRDILNCSDFTTLAACFKSIVRDSFSLNCHEFMESIFKVPGTISNTSLHSMRQRAKVEVDLAKSNALLAEEERKRARSNTLKR